MGTKSQPHEVASWSDAFDWCREARRPLYFRVGDELAKCYPSGRLEALHDKAAVPTINANNR